MKRMFRTLIPPPEKSLGTADHEIKLFATGAMRDDKGGVRVELEVWNGTLKHSDGVTITSSRDRKRFVSEASAAEPQVPRAELNQVLVEWGAQIRKQLDQMDTGAAVEETLDRDVDALWEKAKPLAMARDLMKKVADTVAKVGLIGERKNAKILYLAATARLLTKLVNIFTKGPSSAGKSFSQECVLALFPPSAYVDYSCVSPRYLCYCIEDLRHKIIFIREAAAFMDDSIGAYLIRTLLSEGRLVTGTVEKNEKGILEGRRIFKEGPTALFTTTCRPNLDPELETRALSIYATDTPAQSRAIVKGLGVAAEGNGPDAPDLASWHALQEWLALAGERRVIIPYGRVLGEEVQCTTVRIRRDFTTLISMIRACAILHQAQRQRAPSGAIVATLEDYQIVSGLMADYFSAAQQDGLTNNEREAVEAVRWLCQENNATETGVSTRQVAERLGLDRSAAQRRLSGPIRDGYVKNLETRRGCAAAYVPGDTMPDVVSALPTSAELAAALGVEWQDEPEDEPEDEPREQYAGMYQEQFQGMQEPDEFEADDEPDPYDE